MLSGKSSGASANAVTSAAVLTANALALGDGSRGLSSLANAAAGRVLASGTPPAYTATPSLTSVTFGAGTALSAYQEGTWTPTDNSGAGLVFTNIASTYTRIGRAILITGIWQYPTTANTNGVSVSGLPFNAAALSAGGFCGSPILTDLVSANWFLCFVGVNSAIINLTNQQGSAGIGNNTASGHVVRVSAYYHV